MTKVYSCLVNKVPTPIQSTSINKHIYINGNSNVNRVLAPVVAYNFENVTINGNPNVNLSMDISKNAPTLDNGAFQNAIIGSGQTFPNASAFQDVMYLMSLCNRFRYY